MPRIVETTVYGIGELAEAAKARAREWYITEVLNESPAWYEGTHDDFENVCKVLGITLDRLDGGRNGEEPGTGRRCIWFSGFCHQGDGACFEGTWEYAPGSPRKIRQHAPGDTELHAIADALAAAAKPNFYQLEASIKHEGRYNHEYCMRIDTERTSENGSEPTEGSAEAVTEAMRELARWLYRKLELEYDHQVSDKVVDEAIATNGWTFTENGRRFAA